MTVYNVGDNIITRKPHACGCSNWQIVRTGADYKLKCDKCGKTVMLSSEKFHKAVKQIGGKTN